MERRAEAAGQATLGGKAIQTLLSGGSALDKVSWLKTPAKKPFDRSNEVVMERTSSPNIFNLKGDAKALGLEGVKIPTMVLGHSARGAKSLQIEIKGKSFDVKDDLKAAGFKWDPVEKTWYHPREMTGESVRRDVATTLKDMKAALQKNPAISLHLVRAR
jgi:hypothetical protein